MDLWIKTQDGLSLMKVDNIFSYSGETGSIATIIQGRGILKLAQYKSDKRALEVLDEILKHINKYGSIFEIYELPKE